MRKIRTGAVEFPPLPCAPVPLLDHILVACAVELGNSLATDLDVELQIEAAAYVLLHRQSLLPPMGRSPPPKQEYPPTDAFSHRLN